MANLIKQVTYNENDKLRIFQEVTNDNMFLAVEVLRNNYPHQFYIEQKYLTRLLSFTDATSLLSFIDGLPSVDLDDHC